MTESGTRDSGLKLEVQLTKTAKKLTFDAVGPLLEVQQEWRAYYFHDR